MHEDPLVGVLQQVQQPQLQRLPVAFASWIFYAAGRHAMLLDVAPLERRISRYLVPVGLVAPRQGTLRVVSCRMDYFLY